MRKLLSKQRGDISIYIALLMLVLITSGAMVLVSLLAQQGHLNRDIETSERAYGAADSGLEEAFYTRIKKNQDAPASAPIKSTISYGSSEATYQAEVSLKPGTNGGADEVCAQSQGFFASTERQLATSNQDCGTP